MYYLSVKEITCLETTGNWLHEPEETHLFIIFCPGNPNLEHTNLVEGAQQNVQENVCDAKLVHAPADH